MDSRKKTRRLKKKKDREKRVKVKMVKRKANIRYEAKMEKEAKAIDWSHREKLEPIRNPDKEKNKKTKDRT